MIVHTLSNNGVIRDSQNKIVGFYDKERQTLIVDGVIGEFQCQEEYALDLFAEIFGKK